MTDLFTYIKERIVLLNWAALAFALVCFAHGSFGLNSHLLAESVGVLVFLVLFRLFDDVANSRIDQHKPNRSYTISTTAVSLKRYFYALYIGFTLLISFQDGRQAILLITFLLLSEISYYILFPFRKTRLVLPLLKYPFAVIALGSHDAYATLGLFLILVLIEYRDEDIISKITALPILITAYTLCYFIDGVSQVSIIFLILSIASLLTKQKETRYLLLFLYILTNTAF
ncbi:MAG: hypothetical protein P8I47_08445 [Schleiferiaceae bacterium]|jgi:hypothetical protein|nr:hypothetical protein [Schleiferiaceae bacterium]MDG1312795.1 hypothetical protein [Schleiferiaceae bacterium]MDG1919416.1 hypothetical protein [Schleiferiaceae bacterium]MDG2109925.1 hypothetical protein [Schleiferiaceae bacterium]